MKSYTEHRYPKISKVDYINGTYYYGDFSNGLKNGYGKLCNVDSSIIMAGLWSNDTCIQTMSELEIEEILKDKY